MLKEPINPHTLEGLEKEITKIINSPESYRFSPPLLSHAVAILAQQVIDLDIDDIKLTKKVNRLQNKLIVHNYVDKRDKHEND